MKYGSVCSGIEAATVAWKPLGWEAQWFSEIGRFQSLVLEHHYPWIPNLGDMTQLIHNPVFNESTIDLLVGGTPCQDFSVGGFGQGLDGERGNLTLEFIRILERKCPKWFVWENVPGLLRTNGGKDFARILSEWTLTNVLPQPFATAGVIESDFYSVAWRLLDAQYSGVPQRRRRLFVVGFLGNWRPPFAVLFEPESIRGTSAKRPKAHPDMPRAFTPGNRSRDYGGVTDTLMARDYKDPIVIVMQNMVRRLTPLEYERLQGFPDNYTGIAGATNAKRYTAIGNSMAVPCMRWIGERIQQVDQLV